MTKINKMVQETLSEIADEVRPASLAAPALRRAGQIRLRRTATATAAGAAAVAALIAVPVVVLRDHAADSPGLAPPPASATPESPSPTPGPTGPPARTPPSVNDGPVTLPGGWLLAGGRAENGATWIWDRVKGRYRTVPYRYAHPAPVGNLVAVESDSGFGVLNLRTDRVHWLHRSHSTLGGPDWTPDGRWLAYWLQPNLDLYVADAVNGTTRRFPSVDCIGECGVKWLPGETEFAMARSGDGNGLQAYSIVDGRKTRLLPWYVGARQAWSPDGRFVVASVLLHGVQRVGIVETATGAVRATIPADDFRTAYWTDDGRVLMIEHGGVRVYSLDGAQLDFFPLPVEFREDELPVFSLARA